MPVDPFAEEGINPNEPTDVFSQLGNISPKENESTLSQVANYFDRAADPIRGVVRGASEFPRQAINMFMPEGQEIPQAPGFQTTTTMGDVGNIAGEMATFLAGGGALKAAMKAKQAAPYLGNLFKGLTGEGLGSQMAAGSLGGAGYGAVMDDQNRGMGALFGGALGGAAPVIGKGIEKAINPSQWFKSKLTPEQLEENLRASRGTNTALGNVIESPSLQTLNENIARKIIGSGSEDVALKTAKQVEDRGQSILDRSLGEGSSTTYSTDIQNSLNAIAKDLYKTDAKKYLEVDRAANESGIRIGRKNIALESERILKEINESPRELRPEVSSGILNALKRYADSPWQGISQKGSKLKHTNIFRGVLGEKFSKEAMEGNRFESGIYARLKKALTKDINSSIPKSKSDPIRQKYNEAQNFHRENIAPLQEPEIAKFLREGGDPDTIISSFVKGGAQDRGLLLEKLMSKLPDKTKGLIQYGHLSPAVQNGRLNANNLQGRISQLGPNQRSSLFPEGLPVSKGEIGDYERLVKMNKKPLSAMYSPETGRIAADFIPTVLAATSGEHFGGTTGALGALAAMALGGRGVNKLLTSEKIRESFVKNRIKNLKDKKEGTKINPQLSSIFNALLQNARYDN